MAAVQAARVRDDEVLALFIDDLVAAEPTEVASELQRLLHIELSSVWGRGWQPADIDLFVGRELDRVEVGLLGCAIAVDAAAHEHLAERVAPDWMAQVRRIDARVWWDTRRPWLHQVDGGWSRVLSAAVRLLNLLATVPELPMLAPPPSQWHALADLGAPSSALGRDVLGKVRALLAKAESTNFQAEAEALTAKAQELITRHRIERVVLRSGPGREEPIGRRIGTEDPYADAKAMLLGEVAAANGCTSVWSRRLGFATVFGGAADLGAAEELYTSLLVQAGAGLRREGSKRDGRGRNRTTRFRRSFLVAFAVRIGCRLREAADRVTSDAEAATGTALVPLLARDDAAAQAAATAAFPDTVSLSPAASDWEGWVAGTVFGDSADLSAGPMLERRSA